jgi:outer membrane murein-binding lipoprotein Lpp
VLAAEAIVKLGVNALISSAAIAALTQLIPYSVSQQAKLQEIQSEVKTANVRVDRLKAEFANLFDPHQTSTVVQEQANRIPADSRTVVLGDVEPLIQPTQAQPTQAP